MCEQEAHKEQCAWYKKSTPDSKGRFRKHCGLKSLAPPETDKQRRMRERREERQRRQAERNQSGRVNRMNRSNGKN